ncbi:hypothetical protein [Nocardioides sp.]|uniref:hypothetical protein n=1 Tax=Nocardioides sp. TaxID=35761 RepID=UPI003D137D82
MTAGPLWPGTSDAPGLVAIGIGGRRRRAINRVHNVFVTLLWNKWVGTAVAGGISTAIGKVVVEKMMGP